MPDLRGVESGDLGPLGDRVTHADDTFKDIGDGAQFTVVTKLPN